MGGCTSQFEVPPAKILWYFEQFAARFTGVSNRPFYSCGLSTLAIAFE